MVTMPFLPNKRMADKAITKGGDIIGKVATARKNFLKGMSTLVMEKAKIKPIIVPIMDTQTPRIILL